VAAMPRGILEETICHHGGLSHKEKLQEELQACTKASARIRRKLGMPLGQEPLFLRKGRIRTSQLDFFNLDREVPDGTVTPTGPLGSNGSRQEAALQVFNDPIDEFQSPPVGLEQIDVRPKKEPFVLEEVQLDQPGRRSVEIPIHSPEEAKAFAANYAVASHTPVDVDLEKNEIVPDDPTQAPPDQPEEEIQYWVMEGSDGSGPVVVHHEHHVSHAHHDHHAHHAHHGGKDGMSYSHEETITHTGNGGHHGEGHMMVRHHVVHRVEPQRQRFVPPPPPPDDDMRLLDEPQVESLQPKIVLGGLLAIFAQVYLWGNVFVTLFKPNRPPPPGTAPVPSPREELPAQAPQVPLVLFGAGGAVGEAQSMVPPNEAANQEAPAASAS